MANVALITGDGIGPEIVEAACRCIDATGAKINWESTTEWDGSQWINLIDG